MKKFAFVVAVSLAAAAPLWSQQAKSQKEFEALKAIEAAMDPDSRIAAVHSLLTTFKNTEFKEWANSMAMNAYGEKNDFENMLLYGEETLAINPENAEVLSVLAYAIPTRTREFDLDKGAKLSKAEDFARRALRLIPTMEKRNPNASDEDWLALKKDLMAQSHDALGLIAFMRSDYTAAEQSFQQSLQVANTQSGLTYYHYANTMQSSGQTDKALEIVEKSIAAGGVKVGAKDLAKELKAKIIKARAREMFQPKPAPRPEPSPAPAASSTPAAETPESEDDAEEQDEGAGGEEDLEDGSIVDPA